MSIQQIADDLQTAFAERLSGQRVPQVEDVPTFYATFVVPNESSIPAAGAGICYADPVIASLRGRAEKNGRSIATMPWSFSHKPLPGLSEQEEFRVTVYP